MPASEARTQAIHMVRFRTPRLDLPRIASAPPPRLPCRDTRTALIFSKNFRMDVIAGDA